MLPSNPFLVGHSVAELGTEFIGLVNHKININIQLSWSVLVNLHNITTTAVATTGGGGGSGHLGGVVPLHPAGADPERERQLHDHRDPRLLHRRRRRRAGQATATAATTTDPATAATIETAAGAGRTEELRGQPRGE